MRLASLFRRMNKVPPENIQVESIRFDELDTWILKRIGENNAMQQKILEKIRKNSLLLSKDLDEKITILEGIDISDRKENERTKMIVSHNMRNYVINVQKFKDDLCALDASSLDKITDEIRGLLLTLEKRSRTGYEKAAYLIGDELANIREATQNFYLDITKIHDENSELIHMATALLSLQTKYTLLKEQKNILRDIQKKIDTSQSKIILRTKKQKNSRKAIDMITQSKDYAENVERKKTLTYQEAEVTTAIRQLQTMVDFKSLGNTFHVSKKQMRLVQKHKDKFVTMIEKDSGTSLMSLLDEARLNTEEIRSTLRSINEKRKGIMTNTSRQESGQTEELLSEIEAHSVKINVLKNQVEKDKKLYERFNAGKEEIVNAIKEELVTLHVTVEKDN